jgi:alpha-L-fucosidase
MWQPTGALPQAITLDLGRVEPDVGWLGVVPRYHHERSSDDGNVTSYRILTSADGATFAEATAGSWPADGRMKQASFGPLPARYVRFEVRAANGKPAITEITVGERTNP